MTTAYPLSWPPGRPRIKNPEKSRFKTPSFGRVRDQLFNELYLLSAKNIVLSTNIPLKNDGMPYATFKAPQDIGVAVYFQYKGKSMAFACDRWWSIEDNMQAIRHTINALRGISRWGTGDMLQAAFDGFQALSGPRGAEWWDVLECVSECSLETIEASTGG